MTVLQNAFEFTDDDLAANREGTLTAWQRRRLKEKQINTLREVGLIAVIAFFGVFTLRMALFQLAFVAFAAWIIWDGLRHWQAFARDMAQSNKVQSVKGWAAKNRRFSPYDGYRYVAALNLSGTSFTITNAQYEVLVDGQMYHVFYTPFTHTLLSIEMVEKQT